MSDIPVLPEGVPLSTEIPEWVKIAIAEAVILFGGLEQKIVEISWVLLNADLKQKLKLARNPATDNFLAVLGEIEKQAGDHDFSPTKTAFKELAKDRNLMTHGSWNMVEGRPLAIWHKFLDDEESVIGEYFDKLRFEKFLAQGSILMDTVCEYHKMLLRAAKTETWEAKREAQ